MIKENSILLEQLVIQLNQEQMMPVVLNIVQTIVQTELNAMLGQV